MVLRDNIPTIAYPNTWNTPGVGIENGESPREAIVRELQEEIDLNRLKYGICLHNSDHEII